GNLGTYLARDGADRLQGRIVRWKRGSTHPCNRYDGDGHWLDLFVRWPLRRQTDRRRRRIGPTGARSPGARTPGHRGSFSSFSAPVCGPRPGARHWRLAASQPIGPLSNSLCRRCAVVWPLRAALALLVAALTGTEWNASLSKRPTIILADAGMARYRLRSRFYLKPLANL